MAEHFTSIGLVGRHADPTIGDTLRVVIDYLQSKNRTLLLDEATASAVHGLGVEAVSRTTLGERASLVIIIGGDGSLLNVARSLAHHDVPLLGVNLGRLGFLTDISPDVMMEKLDAVLNGDYWEEKRALLHVYVERNGERITEGDAFNDVVLHKWMGARMLEFSTYIDERFVSTTRADGMIVSTPTGSTGYALSGGGPILHPSLDAVVLVPICPHSMSYRPIVVSAGSRIDLVVGETNQADAQVTCDGQINIGLLPDDRVIITRNEHRVRLVHPPGYDYYGMLRAKLRWGQRL